MTLLDQLRAERATTTEADRTGPRLKLLCGCVLATEYRAGQRHISTILSRCPYAERQDAVGRQLHLQRWTWRTYEYEAEPESFQLTGCPPCVHCEGARAYGKRDLFGEARMPGVCYECPDCGGGWTVPEVEG